MGANPEFFHRTRGRLFHASIFPNPPSLQEKIARGGGRQSPSNRVKRAASEKLFAHPESIKARLDRTLLRPGRNPSSARRAFFSSREYQSAIESHFIATGSHSELYPQSFFLIPRVSKRDWIALYCDRVAIRALPAELFSHPESIKARLNRAFSLKGESPLPPSRRHFPPRHGQDPPGTPEPPAARPPSSSRLRANIQALDFRPSTFAPRPSIPPKALAKKPVAQDGLANSAGGGAIP